MNASPLTISELIDHLHIFNGNLPVYLKRAFGNCDYIPATKEAVELGFIEDRDGKEVLCVIIGELK